ncbi:MAG: carboxypeptidase-like regulatory domain-containing protein [Prevotella sp.]|jgi:hypothetical protein|nr:carboxypeptidase-like regulatory domain-containing protein [Prevotella sp.]
MRKTTFLLGCALFLTMFSGCAKEEHNLFSTLYGVVSDHETGDPVSAATIVLSPGGKTTVSGNDGRYEFKDLDAVQYTIMVQKAGYQTNRKTITAIAGESVQADIPLIRTN